MEIVPHDGGGPGGKGRGYGFAIRGSIISSVTPGCQAQQAGIKPGQKILCINGRRVHQDESPVLILSHLKYIKSHATILLEGK